MEGAKEVRGQQCIHLRINICSFQLGLAVPSTPTDSELHLRIQRGAGQGIITAESQFHLSKSPPPFERERKQKDWPCQKRMAQQELHPLLLSTRDIPKRKFFLLLQTTTLLHSCHGQQRADASALRWKLSLSDTRQQPLPRCPYPEMAKGRDRATPMPSEIQSILLYSSWQVPLPLRMARGDFSPLLQEEKSHLVQKPQGSRGKRKQRRSASVAAILGRSSGSCRLQVHQKEVLAPLGVDGNNLTAATSHKQHTLQSLSQDLQELHICRGRVVKEPAPHKCLDTTAKSLAPWYKE